MKNMNPIPKTLTTFAGAVALMALIGLPSISSAQEKGATLLTQHNPLGAVQRAEIVKAADAKAMACPKCKDVRTAVIQRSFKTGVKPDFITVQRHECPGCKLQRVTQGVGKRAVTKTVHVCMKCGSENAFCCATKKSEGPTAGMEQ
jgi:hypothetical protein